MDVTVVGAGLAGSECAWQLAERGVRVRLLEQKPKKRTPAQRHDFFAELVCSNSFRGAALVNAVGLLKEEMRRAGSLIMAVGEHARVPAGGAFAVDRERFGPEITRRLHAHPNVEVVEEEVLAIPDPGHPVVLATGPLTGEALARDLEAALGEEQLAYYDAIAPVVTGESLDWDKVFRASRYDKGGDDAYVNCPMSEAEYRAFIEAILEAEKVSAHEFEDLKYFEGCLPIEVMAQRGFLTLAHGCMKPVGLVDPRTGEQPFAVVQLRMEDAAGEAWNLVGFQTRLKWPEQKRIFRMIPGLENAEFERLGSVHRNTFVRSPEVLDERFELKARPGVLLAGQITGVEGYVESAACGLVLGVLLAHRLQERPVELPDELTALGGLMRHLQRPRKDFQPSNVVWSMMPPLPKKERKRGRRRLPRREQRQLRAEKALAALEPWLDAVGARDVRARFDDAAE
ncbi:MAG TPA: methylenetetrahydrofolate--tRNA-(uracil(54)-C(5))-methyltransferase (FADH(2)-oxidizing) TrmFO [Polyangiaceae bacterium LLY-WYZ-15_(1-7)]|nr:methylenetetrahydrofolate--tRNA-(uracil(54)-C(5))-methyltransferase (FADH(2)-oxidizing) TrmFO [Myxococcales bacterium]MAT24427.1 methylenetetrahydrofolate--tRNA-(uracil(54)-C(5))-methyltransferase (FADH(2)-oxidizing) TrmFO [Sandaracinus sp.]HJL00069.1 methylenetetrahydrofolate--tRNA-(uracil(54)-C(5))-methyltransferase (FADH(2)-oxidizing) TrmFO [Polyangiaceae bacterium LLY-WYZ-15_(1-7)]HJL11114.1 methylenetetrahydrofolate--tRNA-(uracil(54)-C(5))-methyltransferase (FADH(2)-oxidizing) TrmFO [Pol